MDAELARLKEKLDAIEHIVRVATQPALRESPPVQQPPLVRPPIATPRHGFHLGGWLDRLFRRH